VKGAGCSLRIAVVILTLTLLGASLATAAETTEAEYVGRVEPICELNAKANERILSAVRGEVKRGELKSAAAHFTKAAAALRKALAELRAVPQPTADQARLTKWLGYVDTEAELFAEVAKELRAGNKSAAQSLAVRLNNNATLANNTVLDFDFRYCRFEPSRFL